MSKSQSFLQNLSIMESAIIQNNIAEQQLLYRLRDNTDSNQNANGDEFESDDEDANPGPKIEPRSLGVTIETREDIANKENDASVNIIQDTGMIDIAFYIL